MNLNDYSLPQLKQLGARIAKEINKKESASKASVLKKLRSLAREHGLSLEEVVGVPAKEPVQATKPKAAVKRGGAYPAKYRHPNKPDLAWSGRGRRPYWLDTWVANGGALEALENTAKKFEKRQLRKGKAPGAPAAAMQSESTPA